MSPREKCKSPAAGSVAEIRAAGRRDARRAARHAARPLIYTRAVIYSERGAGKWRRKLRKERLPAGCGPPGRLIN